MSVLGNRGQKIYIFYIQRELSSSTGDTSLEGSSFSESMLNELERDHNQIFALLHVLNETNQVSNMNAYTKVVVFFMFF
jgi:hypothetical protein